MKQKQRQKTESRKESLPTVLSLSRSAQGFTLVELLIVLAVIGTLASVLIPNLLGARRRANDTVALQYLKAQMQAQESVIGDTGRYALMPDPFHGIDGQLIPQGIDLAVTTAGSNYCMYSLSYLGTPASSTLGFKTYYASPEKGISETPC